MSSQRSILIATPTPGFGELIQQMLENTGSYRVMVVNNADDAYSSTQVLEFSLAILDTSLGEEATASLVSQLKSLQRAIRLVVILPRNDPSHPILAHTGARAWLAEPFSMAEMLHAVEKALSEPVSEADAQASSYGASISSRGKSTQKAPEWLLDVSRAAQHLTRLSLESAAQAALILREGKLWAYAGQLALSATQELATHTANYWASDRPQNQVSTASGSQGDILRLVHLEATQREYMLYATSLGNGMLLALAFDSVTPFSKIRAQAGYLARALVTPPNAQLPRPPTIPATATQIPANKTPLQSAIHAQPLLEDVPPSQPSQKLPPQPPVQQAPTWLGEIPLPDEMLPEPVPALEGLDFTSAPAMHVDILPEVTTSSDMGETEDEAFNAETVKTIVDEALLSENARTDITVDEHLADTRPHRLSEITSPDDLSPLTLALNNLSYACLLIPRLPQHHLTGDLASHLSNWMGQLCIAFGWRLDYLAVRPEYLLWVASVPPNTAPSYLVRTLRQYTSQRAFASFPDLGQENPSGDFWAPGYLIIGGPQPPHAQVIKEYIERTRHLQGARLPDPNIGT